MRNHLLKLPFCVHPKTGRVCIPITPEKGENSNHCSYTAAIDERIGWTRKKKLKGQARMGDDKV